ncbi:formin 2, putative [Plasmodium relictum]|uniref:Formin 2, putative n=1 Tax=Plasmodium relictum TaxID=85471 RepID=A0A1J1H3H8_PLARL|nr:formin 2, putative [Plasmodium relictum]CRG99112.1 formin 2, putative [Plasmodium relictum]
MFYNHSMEDIMNNQMNEISNSFNDIRKIPINITENVWSSERITLSSEEYVYYLNLFNLNDKYENNFIDNKTASSFLQNSGLSISVLHSIWEFSDIENKGYLTLEDFFICCRLVAHAQNGNTLSAEIINIQPPCLPSFDIIRHKSFSDISNIDANIEWGLKENEKEDFKRIFKTLDINNEEKIEGSIIREYYLNTSNISICELMQIWNISDIDNDGSLNFEEFCIMNKIVEIRKEKEINIPLTVPNELLNSIKLEKELKIDDDITFRKYEENKEKSDKFQLSFGDLLKTENERKNEVNDKEKINMDFDFFDFKQDKEISSERKKKAKNDTFEENENVFFKKDFENYNKLDEEEEQKYEKGKDEEDDRNIESSKNLLKEDVEFIKDEKSKHDKKKKKKKDKEKEKERKKEREKELKHGKKIGKKEKEREKEKENENKNEKERERERKREKYKDKSKTKTDMLKGEEREFTNELSNIEEKEKKNTSQEEKYFTKLIDFNFCDLKNYNIESKDIYKIEEINRQLEEEIKKKKADIEKKKKNVNCLAYVYESELKKYQCLKEERRNLEFLNLCLYKDIKHKKENIKSLKKEIKEIIEDINKINIENISLNKNYIKKEQEIKDTDNNRKHLNYMIDKEKNDLKKDERNLIILKNMINYLKKQKNRALKLQENLKNRYDVTNSDHQMLIRNILHKQNYLNSITNKRLNIQKMKNQNMILFNSLTNQSVLLDLQNSFPQLKMNLEKSSNNIPLNSSTFFNSNTYKKYYTDNKGIPNKQNDEIKNTKKNFSLFEHIKNGDNVDIFSSLEDMESYKDNEKLEGLSDFMSIENSLKTIDK